MGIVPKYTRQEIKQLLARRIEFINRAIILQLQRLGEKCVNHAREIDKTIGFEDQTGNLRSSIGYVIYLNGKPMGENFEKVKGGDEGIEKGRKFSERGRRKVSSRVSPRSRCRYGIRALCRSK